jgi:anthranilate synthase component 1
MYFPDLKTFKSLCKKGNCIPVYRRLFSDSLTPVSAFMKLKGRGRGFLLESVIGGEKIARFSFLARNPMAVIRAHGNEVEITRGRKSEHFVSDDPVRDLEAMMKQYRGLHVKGLPRFAGGAVGYLSYDAVRYFERLPYVPDDSLGLPDLYFMIFDEIVIFDHITKTITVVANALTDDTSPEEAYRHATEKVDAVCDQLSRRVNPTVSDIDPGGAVTKPFTSNFKREEFEAAVDGCKEYIRAGDIFQVVLSQRLSVGTDADPFDIYRTLRVVNPSPFMFYLETDEAKLIGSSPEIMVRAEDGLITVRPLAGTRRRGATDEEDKALAEELLADPKERAEHVMLVDLGRNDVGRVAQYKTVKLSDCMSVERYSHVMHIVSNVTGMLRKGMTAFDALRACLPAGTVSGAPKIRAMEIIDEFEPTKRGPYAGTVGYVDFTGNMDTCITLRTILMSGGRAHVQAGAGIVADSVPSKEYEETLNKARALLKAIETAEGVN